MQQLAVTNPLLSVFLASMVGNLIPFFPGFYLLIVGSVASENLDLGLVPIATLAALGAAIGKFAIYAVGYGTSRVLSGKRSRFNSLRKLLGGSAFLAAFLFAASPFPDDIIFIPLGVMRYSPVKTFISLLSGKFAFILLVVFLFRNFRDLVGLFIGGSTLTTAASVAAFILISVVMTRIDWERVLDERKQRGLFRGLLRAALHAVRPKKADKTPPVESPPSKGPPSG